jgi:hypothetical protein
LGFWQHIMLQYMFRTTGWLFLLHQGW